MNALKYYIISYTLYDLEPLQLIIHSIIADEICVDRTIIIDAIVELFYEKNLEAYFFNDTDEEPNYRPVSEIQKDDLIQHINGYKPSSQLTDYLEKDYFFKATPQSYQFLNEEDRPRAK